MKKYLPVILAVLIVAVIALLAATSCGKNEAAELPMEEEIPTDAENAAINTNVYYRNAAGYLIPVEREIPTAGGIAQNAVEMLYDNSANWSDTALLGVMPTFPEGAEATVTVSGGIAQADLTGFVATDAAREKTALDSLTATLLDLPDVSVVRCTVDGQPAAVLPFGNSVADTVTETAVNTMTDAIAVSAGQSVTQVPLAYLDRDTGLLVPVVCTASGADSLPARLAMLYEAPDESLTAAIPETVELTGAIVSDDTAIIDLSGGFTALTNEQQKQAAKALTYTAMGQENVLDVVIRADGAALREEVTGASLPVTLNSAGDMLDNAVDRMLRPEPTTTTGIDITPSPRPTTPMVSPTTVPMPSPSAQPLLK